MSKRKLIVIGAGPKSLAIAAKNKVLKELGVNAPDLIIIEKNEIAAHWTGNSGYTNGKMTLGTGPEKDIGYPYDTTEYSDELNKSINTEMLKFSWAHYLVAIGKYSDYVDRGKPFPKHYEYANYLRWVFNEVKDNVIFKKGLVTSMDVVSKNKVTVSFHSELGIGRVEGDGVVITGPGVSNTHLNEIKDSRILDIEKFWMNYKKLAFDSKTKIAIVGAGENSASIALALGEIEESMKIDIIVPTGVIFTRGESYFENRVYSDPKSGNWADLTNDDKLNFIRRTDLGVFGQYAQNQLNEREDVNIIAGRVNKILPHADSLFIEHTYNKKVKSSSYDYVVIATGFDQLKLVRDLMTETFLQKVKKELNVTCLNESNLVDKIGKDMAIENYYPKIHLPMISRIKQGPGFANLSSLGRLSDQVLYPYVELKSEQTEKECIVC